MIEPTLVQATAGSGKTRHLCDVANELVKQGVFPVACTYLNSMRNQLLDRMSPFVRVSTLHSLAGQILTGYGEHWEVREDRPWTDPYKFVLTRSAEKMEEDPEGVVGLVEQHQWLLIDEIQDLTYELYVFARALARAGMNLYLVGDEDQNIFEFNGGSSQFMHALRKEFELREDFLPLNHRCKQEVVELSNFYTGKQARSAIGSGSEIRILGPMSGWKIVQESKKHEGTLLSFWRYCFPDTAFWIAGKHHTVHSYKGSEADNVVLVWDPNALRRLCGNNILLAKRLINVALTRTRGNLTIIRLPGTYHGLERPLYDFAG